MSPYDLLTRSGSVVFIYDDDSEQESHSPIVFGRSRVLQGSPKGGSKQGGSTTKGKLPSMRNLMKPLQRQLSTPSIQNKVNTLERPSTRRTLSLKRLASFSRHRSKENVMLVKEEQTTTPSTITALGVGHHHAAAVDTMSLETTTTTSLAWIEDDSETSLYIEDGDEAVACGKDVYRSQIKRIAVTEKQTSVRMLLEF